MRADRLIAMMMLLHARGKMTAQALAERLEVSERTIYRDIDALSAAGVPVYTQPGTGGGIALDEGYRVSLTGLSQSEALGLFAAVEATPLSALGITPENALLKLFAALPEIHRREVAHMQQRLLIDPLHWFQTAPGDDPSLPELQRAVWEDRVVELHYQPVEGDPGPRTIEPYALVAKANIWYVVGRPPGEAMRSYRLSRCEGVRITERHFVRDPDFDLGAYWREACDSFYTQMVAQFPPYPVTLRLDEARFWLFPAYLEGRYERLTEPDADGWLTLRVVFSSVGDARMWVLGLGAHAEVIDPPELRNAVAAMAAEIVAFYADEGASQPNRA